MMAKSSIEEIRKRLTTLIATLEPEVAGELTELVDGLATIRSEVASSHQRLQSVVNTAVDAIITIDTSGTIIDFNRSAEEMFGYRPEEVVGKNVKMLMPQPYQAEHDGYLARYLRTDEPHIIGIGREVVGLRKDGSTFPLDLAVSEFESEGRRQFTGIVRDITQRRAMERERDRLIAQLEEKNAELERFTYTVSHDLKSPLITIRGFLGTLESDARSGNIERMSQDIERIARAADKMKELLDEVLQLSRVGRVANPSESIAFSELVADVLNMLNGPLSEAGIAVEVEQELPTVYGDPVRLREVMQNLIENAVKFRDGDAPRIAIGARVIDKEQAFYVRDNGIGIDPRYVEKVFDLFDQLDPSKSGSGVGLALVKRIIQVHGGRVWVESEGPGKGATFWFTIQAPDNE